MKNKIAVKGMLSVVTAATLFCSANLGAFAAGGEVVSFNTITKDCTEYSDGNNSGLSAFLNKDMSGKVVILSTNDIHGAVKDLTYVSQLRNILEENHATVLLVDSGDFSTDKDSVDNYTEITGKKKSKDAGLCATNTEGIAPVKIMNAVGYDYGCLGNHEFEDGKSNANEIIDEIKYKIVDANLKNTKDSRELKPYEVANFEDLGLKIGFFGLDSLENHAWYPNFNYQVDKSGYALHDIAQKQVSDLKEKEGADIIIGLTHLGVDNEPGNWAFKDSNKGDSNKDKSDKHKSNRDRSDKGKSNNKSNKDKSNKDKSDEDDAFFFIKPDGSIGNKVEESKDVQTDPNAFDSLYSNGIRSIDLFADVDNIDILLDGHSHTTMTGSEYFDNVKVQSCGIWLRNIGVTIIGKDESGKYKIEDNFVIPEDHYSEIGEDTKITNYIDYVIRVSEKEMSAKDARKKIENYDPNTDYTEKGYSDKHGSSKTSSKTKRDFIDEADDSASIEASLSENDVESANASSSANLENEDAAGTATSEDIKSVEESSQETSSDNDSTAESIDDSNDSDDDHHHQRHHRYNFKAGYGG